MKYIILGCALVIMRFFNNIFISVSLGGAFFCPVILFPILKSGIADRGRINYYYFYRCPAPALLIGAAVSSMA
jgi:hypothetical protein